jgi:plastocyanin
MTMTQPTQKGRGRTIAIVAVVIILAGALGAYYVLSSMNTSAGSKTSSGSHTITVNIPSGTSSNQALNYSPHSFAVVVGVNNTVNFVNQDSATHTVTANDGSFDSGNIVGGSSWTHTFSTAGTYSFHCKYHTWMTATIVVKSA